MANWAILAFVDALLVKPSMATAAPNLVEREDLFKADCAFQLWKDAGFNIFIQGRMNLADFLQLLTQTLIL